MQNLSGVINVYGEHANDAASEILCHEWYISKLYYKVYNEILSDILYISRSVLLISKLFLFSLFLLDLKFVKKRLDCDLMLDVIVVNGYRKILHNKDKLRKVAPTL